MFVSVLCFKWFLTSNKKKLPYITKSVGVTIIKNDCKVWKNTKMSNLYFYFYFKMRIKLTWYGEVSKFHLPFLCYRLRNHVQCSGQSRSSHCHKNLLPHHFRDVQRMEKVMFIQEECTLPWAIPLLRPLKQRVKEFLKNYVQYILYQ